MGTDSVMHAPRQPRNHRALCVALMLLLGAGALSCTAADETVEQPIRSVTLIGDSLADQAQPVLSSLIAPTALVSKHFGGTAPCDWLGTDFELDATSVAVVTFAGNSLTPCMTAADNTSPHGQALVDRYRADLATLVAEVRATGARVLIVGQPVRVGPLPDVAIEVEGINAIAVELANQDGVAFVDAGAAVEDADGRFTVSLPCLPGEETCGPDGTNVVRSDDGVHFCPGASTFPCLVYSSGAFRFASAIVEGLNAL